MELFFLALLVAIMATALGVGYPVAFALPGAAILTIILAGVSGQIIASDPSAYFHQGGPIEWLSSGVTNLRGVYWEVERDTLIAIPLFIFMGIMLQKSKIAEDLLVVMANLFGPVPGGLGISGRICRSAVSGNYRNRWSYCCRNGADFPASDVTQQLLKAPCNRNYCCIRNAWADNSSVNCPDNFGRSAFISFRSSWVGPQATAQGGNW
jgi:hypothetical protein